VVKSQNPTRALQMNANSDFKNVAIFDQEK